MEPSLTFGLTHLALLVKRIDVSVRFYQQVFDMQLTYRHEGFAQLETPGMKDVLVLEEKESTELTGKRSGIQHFGFRLKKPSDISIIKERVIAAGGSIKEEGNFSPEEPYLFLLDPDGYEVEVWYE
ncbi:glyoxalase/bleomycin resistance protein/dioxygenase superfamily protein [Chitinophaga niastensis]|uniref:Glyoxalase/bleomycin resistance protein/dioxygenase superfamily protein n=1 Tax=Chitinophaga niastensis TaxID=536980 RepID=A0A2P8HPB8_CHINA|nr:VOC family protein [Chitinophaga niastensis]PSL48066.1 glyoxalase/bleomycin resistance protein/dioxygenase superfamily protein [Chitinophaga niastensis]